MWVPRPRLAGITIYYVASWQMLTVNYEGQVESVTDVDIFDIECCTTDRLVIADAASKHRGVSLLPGRGHP